MAEPPQATHHYASACTRVDGYDVTYLTGADAPPEAGEPETVLLLHGFGAWSEAVWGRTIPALADRYRVLAPDLVGFGLSSKPEPGFLDLDDPLGAEVRFVVQFLDAIGVRRAHVVGHSFGGALALRLALDHPDRVDKLVLVSSMGLGRSIHYVYKALALPLVGPVLVRPDRDRIRRMWSWIVHDPALVTDEVVERNFELLSEPGAVEMIAAARHGVNLLGQKILLAPRVRELSRPTLLVWGRQDRMFPVRHAIRARARVRDGQLVVLDRCGHVPPFETPERFNAAVRAFLDKPAAPPVPSAAPVAVDARDASAAAT